MAKHRKKERRAHVLNNYDVCERFHPMAYFRELSNAPIPN